MSDKVTTRNRLLAALVALLVVVAAIQVYIVVETKSSDAATQNGLTTLDAVAPDSTQAVKPDSTHSAFDDNWMFGMRTDDPFEMMRDMQERMDRMFEHAFANLGAQPGLDSTFGSALYAPNLDVTDQGDRYQVKVDLPGIDQAALQISVEDQTLRIEGKREEVTQEKDAGGNVIRSERRTGQFARAVTLPGPVNSDKMQTSYHDGVLTIELPKEGGTT